jgi:hypothetical protein
VHDADEGGEDDSRESEESQGHGRGIRGVGSMTASYRTG